MGNTEQPLSFNPGHVRRLNVATTFSKILEEHLQELLEFFFRPISRLDLTPENLHLAGLLVRFQGQFLTGFRLCGASTPTLADQ